MALFASHKKLYEYELSQYGVTYCNDCIDYDRLIVAPKLWGCPEDINLVEQRESAFEILDYLYIGDTLVGISYEPLSPVIYHFMNGYVPDELKVTYIMDVFMVSFRNPESEEDYRKAYEICKSIHDFISIVPTIPHPIAERLRNHIALNIKEKVLLH